MIRLGTRRSALAVAQARLVADGLGEAEIVPMSTAGGRPVMTYFSWACAWAMPAIVVFTRMVLSAATATPACSTCAAALAA